MSRGIDYAWGRPRPAKIAEAGYAFVMRYLSADPSKNLTADERQALHAAGLGVGVVWETTADRALAGTAAGSHDGAEARNQATACGFPDTFPLFGAIDFDAQADQLNAVEAYLRAGGFAGPYGSGMVCEEMHARGAGAHTWTSAAKAWGGHRVFAGRHIDQGGTVVVDGVQCDEDEALSPCCIWFPAPTTHKEDAPMGKGYVLLGADGGLFPFGDIAGLVNSLGNPSGKIAAPHTAVDVKFTPTGQGYWVIASDGGVFAYGDAEFDGSMGGQPMNAPVAAFAPAP